MTLTNLAMSAEAARALRTFALQKRTTVSKAVLLLVRQAAT